MVLILNKKIEVRKSPIHGYGVFATKDILPGEILEECHFILFPQIAIESADDPLCHYGFAWPHQTVATLHLNTYVAIPFGTGCIYNSSKDNNAEYINDINRQLIVFKSIQSIKKGEEICTDYQLSIESNKHSKPKQTFTIS